MSAEENIAIYRRFVEQVLHAGNADAADEFMAVELIDHSLPPDVPGTREGFKEWFRMFHAAFPDAKWILEFIDGKGDIVYHHKSFVGTHRGEYLGVAGTGKQIRGQETGIIRFKDGKMVEFWGTFDDFGIARQLGLIPEHWWSTVSGEKHAAAQQAHAATSRGRTCQTTRELVDQARGR